MVILWMLRWVLLTLVAVAKTEQCKNAGDYHDDLQLLQRQFQDLSGEQEYWPGMTLVSTDFYRDFPPREVPKGRVGKDMGNLTRRHFFIIGPEGSSTRFWSMQLADGMNLTNSKVFERCKGGGHSPINNQASLCHLSLPHGSFCRHHEGLEPVMLDFGGQAEAYEYTGQETIEFKTVLGMSGRFFVDPVEVVKHHHQRNDAVTILLVIRDPRASLENKVRVGHCTRRDIGRKEQQKAFELILKAARAAKEMKEYQQDIHVVCYEDVVKGGAPYIKEKVRSMGITPSEKDATFFDGNEKYHLEGHDGHDCESVDCR